MRGKIPKLIPVIFFLIICFFALSTCVYTVDQTEYAVLVTFGAPSAELVTPGLKFKLPYPIQTVKTLSRETFSLTFGYEENQQDVTLHERDAKMITGDENIILADLEVQWRIVDPIAYLFNTEDPITILYNATSSSLRGVIGSSTVDDALTDGRTLIMSEVRDSITGLVEAYDMGIAIVNINLQDVDLPNEEVGNAFKKVTSAREERMTKINQASQYRNEKINTADGHRQALISKAEAQKVSRIEQAKGDVAKFNAIYSEYENNKAITRYRLMVEMMEEVLPNAKVYIMEDSSGSSTVRYLPLDTVKGGVVN